MLRPKSAYKPPAGNTSTNDANKTQNDNRIQKKPTQKSNGDSDDYSSDEDQNNKSKVNQSHVSANANKKSSETAAKRPTTAKQSSPVSRDHAQDVAMEIKLKLQSKGYFYH